MKQFRKSLLIGAMGAMLMVFPSFAEKLDSSKVAPVSVSLESDGTAVWVNGDDEEAKKYTVVLERLKDGTSWNTAQTKTTEDGSYQFSVSKTGYYRVKVRAHFYDDTYSAYSTPSDRVLIDEDDAGSGPSGSVIYYSPGPGYDQSGVPIASGSAQPLNGTTGTNYYGTRLTGSGTPNSINYNAGSPSGNANSGWVQGTKGWWYKYSNGSYPKNGWERINDKWYFFDGEGYVLTGWIWWNNNWYLALTDGQMATGWRNVNDRWYYLNDSGIMQTGYQLIDGKTYYLDANGARVQNGTSPDGHTFDANGVMIS